MDKVCINQKYKAGQVLRSKYCLGRPPIKILYVYPPYNGKLSRDPLYRVKFLGKHKPFVNKDLFHQSTLNHYYEIVPVPVGEGGGAP